MDETDGPSDSSERSVDQRQRVAALEAQIASLKGDNRRLEESRRATAGMLLEMVSGLSHELSQPLSAIIAYTSAQRHILQSSSFSPRQVEEGLARIAEQAERAADFIRRLRGLVRRSLPQSREQRLADVVGRAVARVEIALAEAGLSVRTVGLEDVPSVWIDSAQVEQALIQLLCNSIEKLASASADGREVVIEGETKGEFVQLTLRDSGPGLSEDEVDSVFMPFVSTKRDHLGLGLPMARSLIDAQNGRLWAETSRVGAVFKCTLPIGRVSP